MIERRIIIGMIVSTDLLKRITTIFQIRYIESTAAQKLALWCVEYFSEYKKAPGKDIEGIFYEKLKDGRLDKTVAEEIEIDILPGLSEEYENTELNIEYLLQQTIDHFNEIKLRLHNKEVSDLTEIGKVNDAIKLQEQYEPIVLDTNVNFPSVKDIEKMDLHSPKQIMTPWLREGEYTLIFADVGVGKSLLALTIGYICGMIDYEDISIGDWWVRQRTGCLYIDGELGYEDLKNERYDSLTHLGQQAPKYKMRFWSVSDESLAQEKDLTLSKRTNQQLIAEFFKNNTNYKICIVDNVSTAMGLEDENSNSEWNNKVAPFIRDMKAMGVALIILDHSGKDHRRGQRGSSAKTVMASNVFSLTDHDDKEHGQAWFKINRPIKQRSAGKGIQPFNIKYSLEENRVKQTRKTTWEIDSDDFQNYE